MPRATTPPPHLHTTTTVTVLQSYPFLPSPETSGLCAGMVLKLYIYIYILYGDAHQDFTSFSMEAHIRILRFMIQQGTHGLVEIVPVLAAFSPPDFGISLPTDPDPATRGNDEVKSSNL